MLETFHTDRTQAKKTVYMKVMIVAVIFLPAAAICSAVSTVIQNDIISNIIRVLGYFFATIGLLVLSTLPHDECISEISKYLGFPPKISTVSKLSLWFCFQSAAYVPGDLFLLMVGPNEYNKNVLSPGYTYGPRDYFPIYSILEVIWRTV